MTGTDPSCAVPSPAGTTTAAAALRELRRWQLLNAAAPPPAPAGALPPDVLPALLAPFHDPERVRHDYPLLLEVALDDVRVRPFGELLAELSTAATEAPRVVQDNLRRLERRLRILAAATPDGAPGELVQTAGVQMLGELQLPATVAAGVQRDLGAMQAAIPPGRILGLDARTALALLQAAAHQRTAAARAAFRRRVEDAAQALQDQLAVEAQKDPAARGASVLQKSLGGVGARFVDPAALARVVGAHRGTQRADPERQRRLQQALGALEGHLGAAAAVPELIVLHGDGAPDLPDVERHAAADPCAAAAERFDAFADALLPVLRAVHLAELEQRGAFEPARHEPQLTALRWQDLTADELMLLPVVVALLPAAALAGTAMQPLTRLLVSGRPVQVLAMQTPAADPALGDATPAHARLELGYLGIAFRDAFVQQSTAARPQHLLAGFRAALAGAHPGLHVVDSGLAADGREPPLGAFLHAGAAIEGRAHPLFRYDPAAGETWARRLDISHNPAPETDWPTSAVGAGAAQELAFTFADYALLAPELRGSFAVVPDDLPAADLVPLAEALAAPPGPDTRLPFVWFARTGLPTALSRAIVQRPLVHACRDRLRFWRTLQELAGVRNEHVREAVQRARAEAAADAARERDALCAQHAAELAQVRAEATGAAMQGLARMLLELDPVGTAPLELPRAPAPPAASAPAAPAQAAAPAAAAAAPPAAGPAPAAADDAVAEDAWIESARCSTCNDCINLNPLMFVYDQNKQARIGDPRKGTFAQMVQAAEKCPARCIHPGAPWNPDEPDLPALVARAAPFNR